MLFVLFTHYSVYFFHRLQDLNKEMTPTTFALISEISEELHFSHDEYFMNINKGHKELKRSLRLELSISCYSYS